MFERLREIRTRRGISAQTMTDLLGLETEGAYYKKENGTIKFSLFEAKAIADYLDMTIESIFLQTKFPKWIPRDIWAKCESNHRGDRP